MKPLLLERLIFQAMPQPAPTPHQSRLQPVSFDSFINMNIAEQTSAITNPRMQFPDSVYTFPGAELLPRMVVSSTMETDCRIVHPVRPRREHAETELNRVQSGRVRRGLRQAAVGSSFRLLATSPHGGQQ